MSELSAADDKVIADDFVDYLNASQSAFHCVAEASEQRSLSLKGSQLSLLTLQSSHSRLN